MSNKPIVSVFWFRRDLRIADNAGLFHALSSCTPVLPLFIFDTVILDKLQDKDDARVSFIHQTLLEINEQLSQFNSSLLVKLGNPVNVWKEVLMDYDLKEVYTNNDYEPYARERDKTVAELLGNTIPFKSFKDQVLFEKSEIVKDDQSPYTVFSPYKRKWLSEFNAEKLTKSYPSSTLSNNFYKGTGFEVPDLATIGFQNTKLSFPGKNYKPILAKYHQLRDFPAVEGTSRIGIHLRFGTISIRQAVSDASKESAVWLSELIWRDFYAMILWHFPETESQAFKTPFNAINWINNEEEFSAWCTGLTGYPIVDAGIRQMNATGWMHNRVRMIVASFLTKHLLIDWKWGEAYFARKLLDYDLASNVGGWQWAAGTGNDAAPYFRVFSPELQTKRFDPELKYIKKWIPEFDDPFKYPKPIVDHRFARERAIKAYKAALTR